MRFAASLVLLAASSAAPAQAQWDRFEQAVLAELNRVRQDPKGWARELRDYRDTFRGKVSFEHGRNRGIITQEGVAAVDEAIAFLERQPAMPPLGRGEVLARAARDLAAEQARTGRTGHSSADGRQPGDRARAAGGDKYVGETIAYGFYAPRDAVRQLVIDDGVPGRGHRRLVFSGRYRYAGAACGPHPGFRAMCVINYGPTPDGRAEVLPLVPALTAPKKR